MAAWEKSASRQHKYRKWNIFKLSSLACVVGAHEDDGEALWVRQQCQQCVACRRMEIVGTMREHLAIHLGHGHAPNTQLRPQSFSMLPSLPTARLFQKALGLDCGLNTTSPAVLMFPPDGPDASHQALFRQDCTGRILAPPVRRWMKTSAGRRFGVKCVAATANRNGVFPATSLPHHWNGILRINPAATERRRHERRSVFFSSLYWHHDMDYYSISSDQLPLWNL